jgi:hypothetical protein
VYQTNYFVNGLLPIVRAQTMMSQPANLNDAITRAKAVEAGLMSINITNPIIASSQTITPQIVNQSVNNQTVKENLNNDKTDMDKLVDQMKKLEIKLVEQEFRRVTRNRNVVNRNQRLCQLCGRTGHTDQYCNMNKVVCFNCGERGHTSRFCKNIETNYMETNYDEEDDYYENDEEEMYYNDIEAYEAIRENSDNRQKPYPRKRPVGRPKKNVAFQMNQSTDNINAQEDVIMKNNRIYKKRGQNRFDQEVDYDIVEDINGQKASITFGQLFKNSPNQAAKLRKAFVRPIIKNEQ